MADLLTKIIESENVVWFGILFLFLVGILCKTVRGIVDSVTRERTRRDIAAYIAEGSMTPEQGEKLMAAGKPKESSCC